MIDDIDLHLLVLELQEYNSSFRVMSDMEWGWVIRGHLLQNCKMGEVEYLVDVEIDIHVSINFPIDVPRVFEVTEYSNPKFHKLKDGDLCLGTEFECQISVGEHPDLVNFFKHLVLPYYYSYHYFREHGTMPYGDRSHEHGPLEFLREFLGVTSLRQLKSLLSLTLIKSFNSRSACPCGNGKVLQNCHLNQVHKLKKFLSDQQLRKCIAILDDYEVKFNLFLTSKKAILSTN